MMTDCTTTVNTCTAARRRLVDIQSESQAQTQTQANRAEAEAEAGLQVDLPSQPQPENRLQASVITVNFAVSGNLIVTTGTTVSDAEQSVSALLVNNFATNAASDADLSSLGLSFNAGSTTIISWSLAKVKSKNKANEKKNKKNNKSLKKGKF
jgi:hypothetical protein